MRAADDPPPRQRCGVIALADEMATLRIGEALGRRLRVGDIVALSGELGAGKTTLARGILRGLGHVGDVPSPSFTIIQPYEPPDVAVPLWHCDLYRVSDTVEVDELGLDEALADVALVVEWPERLGVRLWPEALRLHIAADGKRRRLTAHVPPAWEGRWPPA
jgi:tRNA threonylcarbamoyladenosine biosynthesis protein TsaE